jgi:hypothetical protein
MQPLHHTLLIFFHAAAHAAADERDFRRDAEEDRKEHLQRQKLLLRLPLYDVLSELRAAAQRVHPDFSYMGSTRPVVAVKLTLDCPDPVNRKRHGVATVKVRELGEVWLQPMLQHVKQRFVDDWCKCGQVQLSAALSSKLQSTLYI